MIITKKKIASILIFCLIMSIILLIPSKVSAASDPANAPSDWAFEASSVALNDAIVQQYPELDNGNGFVTIPLANAQTGILDLNHQNISGAINGIENFISIISLNLSNNNLTGEIPGNIDDLSNLLDLNLFGNQIRGQIPSSLGNLTNLEDLNLGVNYLTGEIPSSLGNLRNLLYLSISSTSISGEIPNSLGNLSNLKDLNFYNNQLSGNIPASLGELGNLLSLNLSENQLTGEIPSSLGNLYELTSFLLYNNQLSGSIPASICNLDKLYSLNFNRNQLTGEIPSDIGKLASLEYLTLTSNQLTGEIPISIGDLINLKYVFLDSNRLTGEIPASIGNLLNLEMLFLSNNTLDGEIPESIGNLSNLKQLFLGMNNLSGEIPETIYALTNLVQLDLGNTNLSGEISESIDNLTKLEYLYIYRTKIGGALPLSMTNLNISWIVFLHKNQFTSVPQEVFDHLYSTPHSDLVLYGQTYTTNLSESAMIRSDFEFEGLPAYEQFPNYGSTFTYTLTLPDGSQKNISPDIVEGKVRILGNDLTQVGSYTLTAIAEGGYFTQSKYITNFSINETIEYVSAVANGEKDKLTSTKIAVAISKVPEQGELTIDDIILSPKTRLITNIQKDNLTSFGNGKYELDISGTWDEGTMVDVILEKNDVTFNPDTRATTLHTKLNSTGVDGHNTNENNSLSKSSTLPKTGDSNTPIAILMLVAGLLISGGYILSRQKSKHQAL